MKRIHRSLAVILAIVLSSLLASAQRPSFNKNRDLLIAQFDSKPDADDIHSIAALGCMLAHSDLSGVDYYAVAGAFGRQGGRYIPAPNLFNMAFGAKNQRWTDARNEYNNSVNRIKNRAKTVLDNGGRVWVQEAGQSDITRDWIQALRNDGISANAVKNRVIIVQHSVWNEDQTTPADLTYVRNNADYRKIADGNGNNATPSYRSTNTSFLNRALSSRNTKARALWVEADRVIDASGFDASHSSIPGGGVDFSDCVENWWIFQIGNNANSIAKFWDRYVTNNANTGGGSGGGSALPLGATIALKGNNGKYVSSENGAQPVTCNRGAVGGWEKFIVVDAGGGTIALRGNNGRYISSENGAQSMTCNRTAIGAWEKFTVGVTGNQITLRGNNGRFVSSENGTRSMTCNRTSAQGWERFTWSRQ